ncbi:MAG TPA: 5'-3' exonuclease H3TH domain-containing protein [Thermoanaerobaculia bacterium]|nr:5'-3' exonuclease H3TH domain-containing protein [Thermoanaerobaculia bacterium]
MPPIVHLIDASPYLFRAWFSVPRSVVDARGKPINAVYGFTGFLKKYIAGAKPTHIAVAFDRHFNQSFRNDYFPAYKAHREKSPPELDAQVDPSVAAVEAMGITTFIAPRHEADDIIATIIDRIADGEMHFMIVSSDKDLTQLVSDRVTFVDPVRNKYYDPAGVKSKFGVRPDQITDYLGLCGDAVDNIPGVRGIGPKTAAQLLQRHGSIENLVKTWSAADDIESALLSKRLATAALDAPITVTLDALRYRGYDVMQEDNMAKGNNARKKETKKPKKDKSK